MNDPIEEQLLDFSKYDNFTYEHFEAALEAMSYLYGQGFDLAIWNIETQETMYTANWGDGENK